MFNTKIIKGTEPTDEALEVRRKVFIEEQKIDEKIERDNHDKTAIHIIVYDDTIPIGTARLVKEGNDYYIGRVATLKEYRGKGIGKIAVNGLVEYAFNNGIDKIYVHAQAYVEEFYKKLGFSSYGDKFLEAGIEHVSMSIEKPKQK